MHERTHMIRGSVEGACACKKLQPYAERQAQAETGEGRVHG